MATRTTDPSPPDHGENNFLLEMNRVRKQIKQKFIELIDCVKARECKLLKELDTILDSYREEVEKQKEKKEAFEKTKTMIESEMPNSPIKAFHGNILKQTEDELKCIMFHGKPKVIHFIFDIRIFAELNKLGKLVEKMRNVDYKGKVHPVVSVCEKGNELEQLCNPWGVAVDNKTGNIYVADQYNQCVKVFDSSGKILLKIGDSHGEGKMPYPRGLVICEDRILISNNDFLIKSHNIFIYQLNGNFVTKFGKHGKGEIEFNEPYGLACNESNGDIYICDRINNRIQILSKVLQFKSQFGADKLKHPRDVKLAEKHIFILDESNPCMHLYDNNLILQKNVVSRGEGVQVINPFYFFIDDSNNILISDYASKSIHIFNPEFKLIYNITTSTRPMGVAVDNQGRIVIVCQAGRECLQIF